jgi:hypothetical protein
MGSDGTGSQDWLRSRRPVTIYPADRPVIDVQQLSARCKESLLVAGRKHGSRGIWTVRSRYEETTEDDRPN